MEKKKGCKPPQQFARYRERERVVGNIFFFLCKMYVSASSSSSSSLFGLRCHKYWLALLPLPSKKKNSKKILLRPRFLFLLKNHREFGKKETSKVDFLWK